MWVKARALCQGVQSELNIWVSNSASREEAGLEAVSSHASRLGRAHVLSVAHRI